MAQYFSLKALKPVAHQPHPTEPQTIQPVLQATLKTQHVNPEQIDRTLKIHFDNWKEKHQETINEFKTLIKDFAKQFLTDLFKQFEKTSMDMITQQLSSQPRVLTDENTSTLKASIDERFQYVFERIQTMSDKFCSSAFEKLDNIQVQSSIRMLSDTVTGLKEKVDSFDLSFLDEIKALNVEHLLKTKEKVESLDLESLNHLKGSFEEFQFKQEQIDDIIQKNLVSLETKISGDGEGSPRADRKDYTKCKNEIEMLKNTINDLKITVNSQPSTYLSNLELVKIDLSNTKDNLFRLFNQVSTLENKHENTTVKIDNVNKYVDSNLVTLRNEFLENLNKEIKAVRSASPQSPGSQGTPPMTPKHSTQHSTQIQRKATLKIEPKPSQRLLK